ncbi:MAG: hypothetical protein AB7P16_23490 [Bradyrhizobium sp.]|uniref:hypothetical protein n=1 Tax=Bradyrhizobium sp. TaxID=376 RepID=UPI003D0B85EE
MAKEVPADPAGTPTRAAQNHIDRVRKAAHTLAALLREAEAAGCRVQSPFRVEHLEQITVSDTDRSTGQEVRERPVETKSV